MSLAKSVETPSRSFLPLLAFSHTNRLSTLHWESFSRRCQVEQVARVGQKSSAQPGDACLVGAGCGGQQDDGPSGAFLHWSAMPCPAQVLRAVCIISLSPADHERSFQDRRMAATARLLDVIQDLERAHSAFERREKEEAATESY